MSKSLSFDATVHITGARNSLKKRDYLSARMNYLKCVEQLRKENDLDNLALITREYDNFVIEDPIFIEISKQLLQIIKETPNILQSDITNKFQSLDWPALYKSIRQISKDDIYYALYFSEKFGYINRIKKGRTYELVFIKDVLENISSEATSNNMSKKIAKEEEKHEIIPEPMIEENYLYK
jgi:precorrin-3B methylase